MAEGFTPDADQPGGGGVFAGVGAIGGLLAKGGSLSKEALDGVKADAANMRQSAGSGGWGISEAGGKAYIKAYQGLLDNIVDMRQSVNIAATEASLGGDDYAKMIAKHNAKVARGDEQSFEAALDALEIIAKEAIKAFEAAIKTYNESDDMAGTTFKTSELLGE